MKLTARQHDLLYHQLGDAQWCTPMMLGGTDGSHHSATLTQLVRKGLAERSNRGGHTRSVWQYRRTLAGKRAVELARGTTESLGPSNDDGYGVWIEIRLAEMLADRDFKHDPRITRDDLDEVAIELMSEQVPKARRPRLPIEILVDRACGVAS
jgi:hypothetical protein